MAKRATSTNPGSPRISDKELKAMRASMSINEIAKALGLNYYTVRDRLRKIK